MRAVTAAVANWPCGAIHASTKQAACCVGTACSFRSVVSRTCKSLSTFSSSRVPMALYLGWLVGGQANKKSRQRRRQYAVLLTITPTNKKTSGSSHHQSTQQRQCASLQVREGKTSGVCDTHARTHARRDACSSGVACRSSNNNAHTAYVHGDLSRRERKDLPFVIHVLATRWWRGPAPTFLLLRGRRSLPCVRRRTVGWLSSTWCWCWCWCWCWYWCWTWCCSCSCCG